MPGKVLAKQQFAFRRPQTEEMLTGEFKLYAPFKDPKLGWVCEFEAPGILDHRGKGVGVGPLDAVLFASGHLKHLLNQMVDVSTPRGRPKRRGKAQDSRR
jgi:hypothetical protein